MRKFLKIMLLACAALAPAGTAQAVFLFHAILTADQETPVTPPAQGSGGVATFVLSDDMKSLTYDLRMFGLDMRGVNQQGISLQPILNDPNVSDNVTRIHIHRAPASSAGPIVFGQVDTPANTATRNDLDDLVIDVLGLRVMGAWDGNEGNGAARLATELANLFDERLYINVHTSDFPGGEIRGQILVTPEPGSLALLGIGALGLLGAGLRRHRR